MANKRKCQRRGASANKKSKQCPTTDNEMRDNTEQLRGGLSPDSISPLECLPRELMWKIIGYTPDIETAHALRLTSKSIKSSVDKYVLQRSNMSLIDSVAVVVQTMNDEPVISILMKITTEKKGDLFELRLKSRIPAVHKLIDAEKRSSSESYRAIYGMQFTVANYDANLWECVRECIGDRIEAIHLTTMTNGWRREWPASCSSTIDRCFEGFEIGNLSMEISYLTDPAAQCLLKLLASKKTEYLGLSIKDVTATNPETLLVELSSLVPSLTIHQEHSIDERVRWRDPYFFGCRNVDWAPIFLQMFARNLNNLQIHNYDYPEYLNRSGVNRLRKSLPELDKNISFSTPCSDKCGKKERMRNNYSVKVHSPAYNIELGERNQCRDRLRCLTIKHESRRQESTNDLKILFLKNMQW